MGRKDKDLGVHKEITPPPIETVSDSVLMPERMLKRLLLDSVTKLAADKSECTRFFSHFFDSSITEVERNQFVDHFIANPPVVRMGYPRAPFDLPVIVVLVLSEQQAEEFVGEHIRGASDEDTDAADYVGGMWDASYGIMIMAPHPDAAAYLYNMCKSIIVSGTEYLMSNGVADVLSISGADLTPAAEYQGTNMFTRMLTVPLKVQASVPRLHAVDPNSTRLAGVFRTDVVVDGIRGGVTNSGEEDGS